MIHTKYSMFSDEELIDHVAGLDVVSDLEFELVSRLMSVKEAMRLMDDDLRSVIERARAVLGE